MTTRVAWLHEPIRTFEQVAALVANHAQEDLHLDFKGVFWPPAKAEPPDDAPAKPDTAKKQRKSKSPEEEAAKDIAAFMNADGGSIVIGVGDEGDRASGFNATYRFAGRKQTFFKWLSLRLAPESVVAT